MKRSFRERDPMVMGVVGMTTVAVLVVGTFNLTRLEGGTGYHAAFTEAGGLKPNEDVRIAGVKVGKIKKVGLEGDHVKVSFIVNNGVHFGSLSRLQIKLSTILGSHYLDVSPSGGSRQSSHAEIPSSRTTPAYEVVPALQDLSGALQQINIPQLEQAFNTLSQTLNQSPAKVTTTLTGLRKISRAIADRDDTLSDLLQHSRHVTSLLADRSGDLASLVSNSARFLGEVDARRKAVQSLLTGTVSLSQQITGTVEENRATMHPALVRLHQVVNILLRNQNNLDQAIRMLGPFVTVSNEAAGSGRWFDGYLQNLIPFPVAIGPPAAPRPTGAQKNTAPGTRTPGPTTTPGSDGSLPFVP